MRVGTCLVALAALALASCNQAADPIKIIGSSTVFPFTTAVSAAFVEGKKGARPIVESTGTVAGFETFCSVQGGADIADASRRMIDGVTGAAAVVVGDALVGMISERDLLRVFRDGGSPDQLVEERMTRDVLAALKFAVVSW